MGWALSSTTTTVTSTFTDKNWAVGTGEPVWVKTGANATSFDTSSGRGVQTTLINIKNSGLSLTNSTIKSLGHIKSVVLVVSANGTGGRIKSVKVGETDFTCSSSKSYTIASGAKNETVTFETTSEVTGDIVITFGSTATSKSLYVKSIAVTYETTTGSATAPTFNPPAGSYNGSATISLSAPNGYTGGLRYTLNGDDPTTSNAPKDYTKAFKLTTSTTVKAVALDSEGNASDVATADYEITYNAPTMDLPGGTYPGDKTISLSVKDLGDGIIVYTTDGSDPTDPNGTATIYTAPIRVTTGTTTIKAYTMYDGGNSTVTEATYVITYVNMQEVSFDFSQPSLYGVDTPKQGSETDLTEGQSISSGIVSLTSVTNGSASTRFWNTSDIITLRAYKGAELSLSVPAGYVMSQVVVNTEKNAKARDYTLGTKSCTASKSLTWTGEEQQLRLAVSISASDNPRFTSMTVTVVRKADFIVGDTEDLTAVLPEVSTPDRTIVLNRKVYAGWNTYCVPFSLSQAQLEEAYGAGAVAKAFKGVMVNGDNTSITFEEETKGGILANKPYMLKVANDVTAPQMFTGITLEPATDCETTVVKDGETYTFKGILTPTSLTTDGSQYFLNNAGTSFVLPANSTSKLKATRAYFILPTGSGQAQSFSFRFENGNLTGISEASTDSRHDGSWYTIEGRRIAQPTEKGIYIHGNRKVVVK